MESLGLSVLDEPCAKQSDRTVLDLQIRAVSKQTAVKPMVCQYRTITDNITYIVHKHVPHTGNLINSVGGA